MQLAQLNIGQIRYSLESSEMADFVNNLDLVNGIAESSPGFIWRLQDDSGDATSFKVDENPDIIVNMSVWENVDCLKHFMFKTLHVEFLRDKKDWFIPMNKASYVLWWIEDGHKPTVEEAMSKLTLLREQGESAEAFTLKGKFAS